MIMGGAPDHPGRAPAAGGRAPHQPYDGPVRLNRSSAIRRIRPAMIGTYPMELSNDELRATIKSLSITYDALGTKIGRLTGRHREEAVAEVDVVQSALTKFTAEQTERWRTDR